MLDLRVVVPGFVSVLAIGALGLAVWGGVGIREPIQGATPASSQQPSGPGPVPEDDFREPSAGKDADGANEAPARGGRVVVHLEARPRSFNTMLQSSAPVRRVLEEVHARLVERNWETWELEPSLAESWEVEDVVVLAGGWGTKSSPTTTGKGDGSSGTGDSSSPNASDHSGEASENSGASEDSGEASEDSAEDGMAGPRSSSGSADPRDAGRSDAGPHGAATDNILFGRVREEGDVYIVEPLSSSNPLAEPARVKKSDVERVERGCAFTFHLRKDALWHDGHPFDARDVVFSLEAYLNPAVQSEHARFYFERLHAFEALDAHTVRVFFESTYFLALQTFEDDFTILPSHVYDLSDPDNPDRDPEASPEKQGEYVNTHPRNADWLGLGPYRIVVVTDQAIDAVRFDKWFDPQHGGFVDAIRWRIVADDNAARAALLEGELDYSARLRSRDYLGEFCAQPAFAEHFDKGITYTPQVNYVAWNMRREPFSDVRVRRALAHAFDWDAFIATIGSGLGRRVTASWYCFSPEYDEKVEPIQFDLERARELLLEAGWYDRDGDGLVDKDGQAFEFEFLYANVDAVSQLVGTAWKENLKQLGVGMELIANDFATRQQRVAARDFDAAGMAWILGPTLDPFGHWHSSQAGVPGSGNQPGFADPKADALLEAIQRELDPARRRGLFHELQQLVHDAQPYMFGCVFPTKFAVAKRVRGVQRFLLDPGYSIRRWYVEGAGPRDARVPRASGDDWR